MELTLKLLGAVFVLLGLFLAYLSTTQSVPTAGLVDGKLRPCDPKPSCVSTEGGSPAPIRLPAPGDGGAALSRIIAAVEGMGGSIVEKRSDYLWATFTSRIFRFTDDLELRIDNSDGYIHARSESRVGHSDFGVNRRRIERLRSRLG